MSFSQTQHTVVLLQKNTFFSVISDMLKALGKVQEPRSQDVPEEFPEIALASCLLLRGEKEGFNFLNLISEQYLNCKPCEDLCKQLQLTNC